MAKGYPAWNKGLTAETDPRIKQYAEKLSKRIEGRCQQCGKVMSIKPCKLNSKKFCSRECYHISMVKRIQRKCLQCGRLFYVHPRILKRKGGGKYCSRRCYGMSISKRGNYWYGKKRNCYWMIGRNKHPNIRQRLSESRKKLCHNPEFVKDLMKRLGQAGKKPNKSEQFLDSMLQKHFPNRWKYVGNAGLIIDGECPDFWDGDGGLIELFGEYWHEPEEEKERINFFKKHGYDCLVVWTRELKDEEAVVSKVAAFSA